MRLASDTGWSSTDGVTSKDTLTGTADPNASVTIALGGTVLGTATANASGAWSFTPTGLADGPYTITASETNATGLTGSASLNFTLDTSVPAVTSHIVSGAGIVAGGGLLTAGEMAVFTLTMSEAVMVSGGTPALTLNDGGTAVYDAAHSTSTALVFDYTVAAGQYANALSVTGINLNGAAVTEVAGNAANFAGAVASFGSAGNMHLTAGNQGQQWLVGGPGDTLTGGKSSDTFMFAPGFGKETISNFNASTT